MKTLFTILFVLLVSLQGFGQKKGKVDPKDLTIDSLSKASAALTIKLDSTSGELKKYMVVYTTLKEKVIKYDFDPEKTSFLIDSLRTSRDATFSSSTDVLKDSLSLMKKENMHLQAALDSLGLGSDPVKALAIKEQEKAKAIKDLTDLKGLVDAKIITQEEFDIKKAKLLEKL